MTKTWKLLVVDESPDDRAELRQRIRGASEDRFELVETEVGATAIARLMRADAVRPDCVLLNLRWPDRDALAWLERLQLADGLTVCPVVVLARDDARLLGLQVLRAGAQELLAKKTLNSAALGRAVELAVERWAMARELKSKERELARREQQFRMLADNMPAVVARFDRGFRHTYVNAQALRVTGLAAVDFIGHTNRELGMPESLCERWDAALRAVFDTATGRELEFAFDGPKRRTHHISKMVPECDADAGVVSVLAVVHDVSALRETEAMARADADRLQMALTAAKAGAWSWDIGSGAIDWSRENYELYGRDPALGPPAYADWELPIHPDDRGAANAAVRNALDPRAAEFNCEFRVLHSSLGVRWVLGLGKVHFDADGRALRMIGINLDITQRKQMERALRDADRHKDEFIATLGHELRNPLNVMSAGLSVLETSASMAVKAKAIETMQRQRLLIGRLVDDLLDVSRIRNGQVRIARVKLSIQEAVAQAIEISRPLIDGASHQLAVATDPQPLWVDGDMVRLVQVFSNLLSNAAKYTPQGGKIAMAAERAGADAVITVSDNGCGIPQAMLDRVFELFAQDSGIIDRAQGGLGIGLTLVRRLVELHGGSVSVESAGPGTGSRFRVLLPLSSSD